MAQSDVRRRSRRTAMTASALIVMGLIVSAAPMISGATPRPSSASKASARVVGPTLPGTNCPAFPANNVWNTPITTLPVDANSATWLA
ncbi:MAG: hypothetical protein ABSA22_03170, partial [Acidimicrobiales bacterium]